MISFTTRSANSSTLLSSSSFTSSSTPSRVPTSMRYSISSLVTAGALPFLPSAPMSACVARPTAQETGQSRVVRTCTRGRTAMVTLTGWRFPRVFGTISPRKSTTSVTSAVANATTEPSFHPDAWARSSATEPASAPAPTFTSVFPMSSVERTRSG